MAVVLERCCVWGAMAAAGWLRRPAPPALPGVPPAPPHPQAHTDIFSHTFFCAFKPTVILTPLPFPCTPPLASVHKARPWAAVDSRRGHSTSGLVVAPTRHSARPSPGHCPASPDSMHYMHSMHARGRGRLSATSAQRPRTSRGTCAHHRHVRTARVMGSRDAAYVEQRLLCATHMACWPPLSRQ